MTSKPACSAALGVFVVSHRVSAGAGGWHKKGEMRRAFQPFVGWVCVDADTFGSFASIVRKISISAAAMLRGCLSLGHRIWNSTYTHSFTRCAGYSVCSDALSQLIRNGPSAVPEHRVHLGICAVVVTSLRCATTRHNRSSLAAPQDRLPPGELGRRTLRPALG